MEQTPAENNFRKLIASAIKKAPFVKLTENNTVIDGGYYKNEDHPYRKLKDNDMIDFGGPNETPYVIINYDTAAFRALLKQTIIVLDEVNSVEPLEDEDVEYEVSIKFIHEMEHLEALRTAGVK